jgi:hypothetical protein
MSYSVKSIDCDRFAASVFTLLAQPRVTSSLRCCPPSISSITIDHDELFELPGYSGRAGRLINRPVTIRTKRCFWHPRTGFGEETMLGLNCGSTFKKDRLHGLSSKFPARCWLLGLPHRNESTPRRHETWSWCSATTKCERLHQASRRDKLVGSASLGMERAQVCRHHENTAKGLP